MEDKCIRIGDSKKPLEERNRIIYVSKRFAAQREWVEARINTEQGKLIRVKKALSQFSMKSYFETAPRFVMRYLLFR